MEQFEREFLSNYLKFGLGSMPKGDIDALVMHLLDRYGVLGSAPLATLSNQEVSQKLKAPVSRIKKLRYDAALKFGGEVEEEAQGRLLAAICSATLDTEGENIRLIIEDNLARYWLQGQLKQKKQIFDHSFNTEIVKVRAAGLFEVLEQFFLRSAVDAFRKEYEIISKRKATAARQGAFKKVAMAFAEGAASAAGGGVIGILRAHAGI